MNGAGLGSRDLLAIDVGSSCIKLGWFRAAGDCASQPSASGLAIAAAPLAVPDETVRIEHRGRDVDAWGGELDRWLEQSLVARDSWCLIGSVQPKIALAIVARLQSRRWDRLQTLAAADLPLEIRTTEPGRVGIDRILDAVAVNRVRRPGTPAIIVDMGTAITVDLVGADGAFEGGAIFAGPVLGLSALHTGTASLPPLGLDGTRPPPSSLGKSTEDALAAGAFWGAAGAVRELVRRTAELVGGAAEFYLTGGGAAGYAGVLDVNGRSPRYVPYLVLSGIRVVAEEFAR